MNNYEKIKYIEREREREREIYFLNDIFFNLFFVNEQK